MLNIGIEGALAMFVILVTAAGIPRDRVGQVPFEARTSTLMGRLKLNGSIDTVFTLFSPLGEKKWVEGWEPEILYPRNLEWTAGMVFRTVSDGQDEVWVVAELDRHSHHVVYYRTEPGRLVARVEVRCRMIDRHHTEATVVYSYVGLSTVGNGYVAEWSDAAYLSKMKGWESRINAFLHASGDQEP